MTNQIVADAGSCTVQVWHGRDWVYPQGLERGRHHRLRGPVCTHEVRPVPPPGHHSSPERGWVKGIMANTFTSISQCRGSALALANPAYTSQIDSRTGLSQGTRRGNRFYCLGGVVLDSDANAACNILARLYDQEITLYIPYGDMCSLLAERIRTAVGAAPPGLGFREYVTAPPLTESAVPAPVPKGAG